MSPCMACWEGGSERSRILSGSTVMWKAKSCSCSKCEPQCSCVARHTCTCMSLWLTAHRTNSGCGSEPPARLLIKTCIQSIDSLSRLAKRQVASPFACSWEPCSWQPKYRLYARRRSRAACSAAAAYGTWGSLRTVCGACSWHSCVPWVPPPHVHKDVKCRGASRTAERLRSWLDCSDLCSACSSAAMRSVACERQQGPELLPMDIMLGELGRCTSHTATHSFCRVSTQVSHSSVSKWYSVSSASA